MFNFFGNKGKSKKQTPKDESEHIDAQQLETPTWLEVGSGNPFNAPILDIRSVTLYIISTTRDKSVAENYTKSRADNGQAYIDYDIPNSSTYQSNLKYPHNGAELEGIVFKSDSMDVKWDIYVYGEWFYFVRSWTSELIYKVHYQNKDTELVLDAIETSLDVQNTPNLHEQNINSIMLTHVLGQVWPYVIPKSMHSSSEKEIALYMFSQFGNKATIATKADTLDLKLNS